MTRRRVSRLNIGGEDEYYDKKPQKPAREKIMDLLARRGHSELELRDKLEAIYPVDEVTDAIEYARENGWMTAPEELAERVALELHRKRKGYLFIQQYLRTKGLPLVPRDPDEELRKGRELVQSKLDKDGPFDYEEQMKIQRLLANRGFDDETIRKVIYEKS